MPEAAPSSVELFAREVGRGPTILLLHGLGGDHSIWNGVIPLLEREFRVVAPDLRGHGRTPAPPGATYALLEFEADVLRLLTERSPQPVHLVGLSAGAFVALDLAHRHPGRAKSLTLVNGSAYCDRHTREIVVRWQETFRDGGSEALLVRLVKDLYDADWTEEHFEIVERMRHQLSGPQLGVVGRWAEQLATFDLRGQLSRLKVPTLILQAMSDSVVDSTHGRFLRQSIPGAELKLYRATGHMMPVERPEETATAIREFVNRVESSPGSAAPPVV
ncbi:MAG: alpha/beta fold hydrolase [Thermoplasmata archaeon]